MTTILHHNAGFFGSKVANYFGDGSDGLLRFTVASGAEQSFDGGSSWAPVPGWTNNSGVIGVPSTLDGDMVVVNALGYISESGVTLTTTNRCRGLLLYSQGAMQGTCVASMTKRGCKANPDDTSVTASTPVPPSDGNPVATAGITIAKFSPGGVQSGSSDMSGCGNAAVAAEANQLPVTNGIVIQIAKVGGAGGPNTLGTDPNGSDSTDSSGGGGAGGDNTNQSQPGGSGAAGTCFSGGPGGGGNGS